MPPTATPSADELFSDAAMQDPYPLLDRLREAGPVHHLASQGLHLVLSEAAIREVIAAPEIYSSNLVGLLGRQDGQVTFTGMTAQGGTDVLATADDPDHARQRRVVTGHFSPRAVTGLAGIIDGLVAPRVDRLVADGGGDWMRDVAHPVPVRVIALLMGLPQEDCDQFAEWTDRTMDMLSGVADADQMAAAGAAVGAFSTYLGERLDEAVAGSDDAGPVERGSEGSVLAPVAAEVAAGRFTRTEALMFLLQLATAGAESTTSLLGSAVRALADDPALQERLRADPDLVAPFVEETLRYESPFRGHFRHVTRSTELHGVSLAEGDRLMLLWGSANRDPAAHPAPDAFDLDRPDVRAHSSFGHGIHFCLGAHLARREAVQTITALLARTSSFRRTGEVSFVPSLMVRRLRSLPLEVVPAA